MSDARRYAVWPEPRSRSRSLKGSRPSVPHGTNFILCPRPHRAEALSDDARLNSVWRLSVVYIGPKSRTERPRKNKIGTEVAHVTRHVTRTPLQGQKVKDQLAAFCRRRGHIVAASRTACLQCVVSKPFIGRSDKNNACNVYNAL